MYVVTHARSANGLLRGQLAWMSEHGFEVAVVSSPGPELEEVGRREGVSVFPVPINREISPTSDLRSLAHLVRVFRAWRPHIVNAGTPKAGLLGMLAARFVRVPLRIYTLRGLRLETTSGAKRRVLETTERLAAACSHTVLSISRSLADEFVRLGLAPASKVRLMGNGSSKGVEYDRFSAPNPERVQGLQAELGLPEQAPVIGYVGRFTKDKGIEELVEAFERVRESIPEAQLLLVGRFESGDPVSPATVDRIERGDGIAWAGYVPDTSPCYALMDVLAFPSHREGFGNVCIEAAAAGLPVVGYRATGTVDAVADGTTGTLVDVGDVEGMATALVRYLTDESLREDHGEAGRRRARDEFRPEGVWSALLEEYERLLATTDLPE